MHAILNYYTFTRRFLFVFVFSLSASFVFSQQTSYSAYLSKENSEKVDYAEELGNYYLSENIDSVMVLGEHLFFYGLDQGYPPAIERGKILLAEYFIQTGKIKKGIDLLKPMLNLADEQNDIKLKTALTNRITLGYCKAQDAKSALIWAKRLQELKKSEKDIKHKIEGDLLLAQSYLLNHKTKDAIEIYTTYIKQAKTIHFYRGLASAYAKLGDIYRVEGNIPKAKSYFELSYQAGKKSKLTTPQANAVNNLAIIHFEQNELEQALLKFKLGLELRKKANNYRSICESYFNLGEYYFYTNDYQQAEKYYHESEVFAAKNQLFIDQRDALKGMAQCRKSVADFEMATVYQDKIINLQQEIDQNNSADDEELSRLEQEIWKNDHLYNTTSKPAFSYEFLTWIFGGTCLVLLSLLLLKSKKTNLISQEKPIEK